jgi:hypothetical protein
MILSFLTSAIPLNVLGLLTLPIYFAYFFYCLKRVYSVSYGKMIVKTILFFVLLFFLMVLLGIASAVIMYQMGLFDQMKQGT